MSKSTLASAIISLLAIGASAYVLYQHNGAISTFVTDALEKPCTSPIPYTIGDIDPRFQLSKQEIEAELKAATALWSDAYGSPLFSYEPLNPKALPVIFVYDRRQATITVGNAITSAEASQESARSTVEAARTAYAKAGEAFAEKVEAFNADSKAYSDKVARINSGGGASQNQYKALQAEKASLESRQDALGAEQRALASQGRALSQMIDEYNSKVTDINKIVQTFNANTDSEFEEGQYVEDSSGKRIYIFAYKNKSELLHTLAHEFGHALGIDHTNNPESIMFAYNKSSVILSEEDIAALRAACTK